MRILVDMNLTYRWVDYLAGAGHQANHWSSVGPPSASDQIIMNHARIHGEAVLTNDLDFPQIVAFPKDRAPILILLRGEPLVPEVRGDDLLRAIEFSKEALAAGAIVT